MSWRGVDFDVLDRISELLGFNYTVVKTLVAASVVERLARERVLVRERSLVTRELCAFCLCA